MGQPNERNKIPILIAVENQNQRDKFLTLANNLKNAGAPFSTIYIKKDVHPVVRRESAKLRKREREEKDKVGKVGVNIKYDWKN